MLCHRSESEAGSRRHSSSIYPGFRPSINVLVISTRKPCAHQMDIGTNKEGAFLEQIATAGKSDPLLLADFSVLILSSRQHNMRSLRTSTIAHKANQAAKQAQRRTRQHSTKTNRSHIHSPSRLDLARIVGEEAREPEEDHVVKSLLGLPLEIRSQVSSTSQHLGFKLQLLTQQPDSRALCHFKLTYISCRVRQRVPKFKLRLPFRYKRTRSTSRICRLPWYI